MLCVFDPRLLLHFIVVSRWSDLHASVNFVASAIQEADVDEEDVLSHCPDVLLEISNGTALLIRDSELDDVPNQSGTQSDLLAKIGRDRNDLYNYAAECKCGK